ncbi:MAG TPA: SLBB domain-containing protein, partial [Polyangiaceae bacterium]|nr:SLBB domain-containing protein [Polyangiaceae bacterium]
GKILTDPSVVITVKEYRSKVVTLLGQVQKPGSFALAPGMTLIHAVSLAGGFTSIAMTSKVNLVRSLEGKTKTVVIDAEDIYEGRADDVPLQPGDRIYVPERVF